MSATDCCDARGDGCTCAAEEKAVKEVVATCLKRGSLFASFRDALEDAQADHDLDDAAHDRVAHAAGDELAKLSDAYDWRAA